MMTFDFLDILLVALTVAAGTVAIASPRFRQWAIGVALAVAGVFGGRRLAGEGEEQLDEDEEPDPQILTDPTTEITTELDDEIAEIDDLDDSGLADAWADHSARSGD